MSIAIGVQCQAGREYARHNTRKDTRTKPRSSFCYA
jgi:hypothetical protein